MSVNRISKLPKSKAGHIVTTTCCRVVVPEVAGSNPVTHPLVEGQFNRYQAVSTASDPCKCRGFFMCSQSYPPNVPKYAVLWSKVDDEVEPTGLFIGVPSPFAIRETGECRSAQENPPPANRRGENSQLLELFRSEIHRTYFLKQN